MTPWSEIALLAFDIDGTLTDGATWWGGSGVGWVQRYSVRDGEAILRLTQRLHVVPVSRNQTAGAAERVVQLGLDGAGWASPTSPRPCGRSAANTAWTRPVCCSSATGSTTPRCSGWSASVVRWPMLTPPRHVRPNIVLQSRGGQRVIEEIESRLRDEG